MAEKYLKALLVFHERAFPKVHDLLDLSTRLLDIETEVSQILEDLVILNRYYIETRYPGDYPEFIWSDAEEALASARRVKLFVVSKIQQNQHSS
jgi:HEPN domain-containing protein